MEIAKPETVDLCDSIIRVSWRVDEKISPYKLHGVEIHHHGEYDKPITLADIRRKYPKADLVIAEHGLSGKVYRYGNHGGYWEEIGKTEGYA